MVAEFENQVSHTLEEIKSQGLFKTERVITSPKRAHFYYRRQKCAQHVRQQLSWPCRSSCAHRRCKGSARDARLWNGERAFYLRDAGHSQGAGGGANEISEDRRNTPLSVMLRCQRRSF